MLLRWHSWRFARRRSRTLRRAAWPSARCSPISQTGNGYWRVVECFKNQPPEPLVGNARGRLQFRHRHVSHLSGLRVHQQRPGHERGFQIPCQSKRNTLRVCAVLHWQITRRLLNRHSNRVQPGIRRRKSSANHLMCAPIDTTSRPIFSPTLSTLARWKRAWRSSNR